MKNVVNPPVAGKMKNGKAFTLVELLVVITIIAILSAVAYVAVGGQTVKARNSRRAQDLSTIQSALEIYAIENDSKYPDNLPLLSPKYMPKMAIDPSGDNYVYGVSGNNKKYQVAATIENDDDTYEALVVGNSDVNLIGRGGSPTAYPTQEGVDYNGTSWAPCEPDVAVIDGSPCVPYDL